MSKEEVVAAFQSWLDSDEFMPNRERFEAICDDFHALRAENKQQQLDALMADGGAEADFAYRNDRDDEKFDELIAVYHEKRKAFDKKRDEEESSNLSEKKALISELQSLIQDEENIGKAYKRFNAIKQKWNEIGPVPRSKRRDLQADYSRLIELFYYNINIYRELQQHDFKKNLELKQEIIEKIKSLETEKSVNQVDFLIHKYLDEWDEIGPTLKEEWEKIREEFKTHVTKVFDRIRDHRKEVKAEHETNYEQKKALLDRVNEIAGREHLDAVAMQEATKEVISIQKAWKSIGYAGRSKNDSVWKKFRTTCDAFFERRDALMAESNQEFQKIREKKQSLIDRAKEIFDAEDVESVANELKRLQREWKQSGKLLPKEEFKLYRSFRKYCDNFFNKKKESAEKAKKEIEKFIQEKEAFLAKIRDAAEDEIKEKGEDIVSEWREAWSAIGELPDKLRTRFDNGFEDAVTRAYKVLGVSKSQLDKKRFENKLEMLTTGDGAENALKRERSGLIEKIQHAQVALAQEESKLEFFKFSKDDNPLKQELLVRIDTAKKEMEALRQKKKQIDLTIKSLHKVNEEEAAASKDNDVNS